MSFKLYKIYPQGEKTPFSEMAHYGKGLILSEM